MSMSALLLAAVLAGGAAEARADEPAYMPKLEGKWLIVYAEEGGRRNNAWEQRVATVSGTTLTYEAEGKKRALNLKFGPHQTVKGSFEGGKKEAQGGVYIAGQDYFSISLGGPAGKGDARSSGSFILILRRQK
jgi:hypothetical protein